MDPLTRRTKQNCSLNHFLSFKNRPTYPTTYRMIYFWFSLIFLIGRTILLSLLAAAINDESKGPIWSLRSVSAASWRTESKRLYNAIVNTNVALSGMEFFYITRRLILAMTGTIVEHTKFCNVLMKYFQLYFIICFRLHTNLYYFSSTIEQKDIDFRLNFCIFCSSFRSDMLVFLCWTELNMQKSIL